MEIVPAKFEHLKELISLPYNAALTWLLTPKSKENIESPHAKSILLDGKPIFVGGIVPYWGNRGEAWAVLSPGYPQHFYAMHKKIKKHFESCPFRRIEATVECEFENGHRWIRALGFTLEAPRLKLYFPDGKDASRYALII